jgi:magnesium-transporting ATPase (P-type)
MKNTSSHPNINRPVLRRAELFHSYLATPSGLSDEEASQRLHRFGKNQIEFHRRRSPLLMLLAEFTALFAIEEFRKLQVRRGVQWLAV